jgi:hypothetical protein
MNTALVQWFSKQQATRETSVFGAEFVAMKIGIESLRGLRYKLHINPQHTAASTPKRP